MDFVRSESWNPDVLRVDTVPLRTSDWMRALVAVLSHVATHSWSLSVPTLYAAQLDGDCDAMRIAPVSSALSPKLVDAVSAFAEMEIPAAWLVLHPVSDGQDADLEEPNSLPTASGSLLLPGIPEIGLDHRAAWAAVDIDGAVAHMRYTTHARLTETVDLAVIASVVMR